jgi:hypothetical protein
VHQRILTFLAGIFVLALTPAAARAADVTLAWNPSATPSVGYEIHWGAAPATYTAKVIVGNVTSTVVALPDDKTVYIAVRAYGTNGLFSAFSNEVTYTPPAGSHFVGAPGNDPPNLLWQHGTTRALVAWGLNGLALSSSKWLNPTGPGDLAWRAVGMGDFNGDSHTDVLWQHDKNRQLVVWNMDGANLSGAQYLNPAGVADLAWKVVATGDYNGDGKVDLIWQHDTNASIVVWLMNGMNLLSAQYVSASVSDPAWKVIAGADFNRDGKSDLLWQHATTGALVVWTMNGTKMASAAYMNPVSASSAAWRVRAVLDLNADGHLDLVWQHEIDGSLVSWLMNDLKMVSARYLEPRQVADPQWKIVGGR